MASNPNTHPGKGFCPECGGEVSKAPKKGLPRLFCCEEHKQNHNNRMASRGKALAKIALGWRKARGSAGAGAQLFAHMTEMLDAWNSEDLDAGRMHPTDYAMQTIGTFASGGSGSSRYMDRRVTRVHCSEKHQGCLGNSKSAGGTNPTVARRMARNQGWKVGNDGLAGVCPNCQDHTIERIVK